MVPSVPRSLDSTFRGQAEKRKLDLGSTLISHITVMFVTYISVFLSYMIETGFPASSPEFCQNPVKLYNKTKHLYTT